MGWPGRQRRKFFFILGRLGIVAILVLAASEMETMKKGLHELCQLCCRKRKNQRWQRDIALWKRTNGRQNKCEMARANGVAATRGRVVASVTTPDLNKRKQMACSQLDPAHVTKHVPLLVCPFNSSSSFVLSQRADGVSNGTALWLGGQCLAIYLAHNLPRCNLHSKRPSVIELGSGIGFTACVLFDFHFCLYEN